MIKKIVNKHFIKLKAIVFDYTACGIFFLILDIAGTLVMALRKNEEGAINVGGLVFVCSILSIIALVFFYWGFRYGSVYARLKKDIKKKRQKTGKFVVKKAKGFRQTISRNYANIAGVKLYVETNAGIKKLYLFLKDIVIDWDYSKNCVSLCEMTINVTYYQKSGCILICEELPLIIKRLQHPVNVKKT